jgi:CNT family concentrative nucleoside transporter
MEHVVSALGLFFLVGIAWLFSANRRQVPWRMVLVGMGLQVTFAALVLLFPPGRAFFDLIRRVVTTVLEFTNAGSEFLFGELARPDGAVGLVFAFRVLPTIVFFSTLMGILYHLGLMQRLVVVMARIMSRSMGVSGGESLSVAANVFVGQTEAPLVIRPYIPQMTRSELMVLMTGGMATIAGGVLAGYVSFGIDAGHLLAASVMSAPAALVMARILVPETQQSLTKGKVEIHTEKTSVNVIDAAADGASQGLQLALNVGAMLLAFLALIALVDAGFGWVSQGLAGMGIHGFPASLQEMFGYLLWPVAWAMGVPPHEAFTFAGLLGQKISINEFVAYASLAELTREGALSHRTIVIGTYALCGFANFGSIGIQLGGIGPLAPERRHELAQLGLRALLGGALASAMTACIAGMML